MSYTRALARSLITMAGLGVGMAVLAVVKQKALILQRPGFMLLTFAATALIASFLVAAVACRSKMPWGWQKMGVVTFVAWIAVFWLVVVELGPRALDSWRTREVDIDALMDTHAGDAVTRARDEFAVVLDYSQDSIARVEGILGKLHERHKASPLDGQTLGRESRLWGAYLGAVIKRARPGRWQVDSEVSGKRSLPLVFGEKDETYPCTWVHKRITSGEEDNVEHKFKLLILQRSAPPGSATSAASSSSSAEAR